MSDDIRMMSDRLAFTASKRPEAQEALTRLISRYGDVKEEDADIIVALGGDGAMLDALRRRFEDHKPVYGMNRGTVGFLMNEYEEDDLKERIAQSAPDGSRRYRWSYAPSSRNQ